MIPTIEVKYNLRTTTASPEYISRVHKSSTTINFNLSDDISVHMLVQSLKELARPDM